MLLEDSVERAEHEAHTSGPNEELCIWFYHPLETSGRSYESFVPRSGKIR